MSIRVIPLGAGQDVGKSCILVTVDDFTIMFDCGMHMGFSDHRRFPDFAYITRETRTPSNPFPFTKHIDCLIISHFHLDHCGALPFFTEMCGYDGPIYMTHPTKAICPILLEDYRRITVDKPSLKRPHEDPNDFFTAEMIATCMNRVVGVQLHETLQVKPGLWIKPYYAGHVLGAAMFLVMTTLPNALKDPSIAYLPAHQLATHKVLYTGDYNMTPDRHLGAAWIDYCEPDVIITESTYATTVRDSKRARESALLKKIISCVRSGGKVLIPVFALGRAQELCILLESYWRRMPDLQRECPIYFTAGLTEKANHFYRLFIQWTNENVKRHFEPLQMDVDGGNLFDFRMIRTWDPAFIHAKGPAVLFATPGMLHQGTSFEVFTHWAPDARNMIILPGYCVAGTVGAKVLRGDKRIRLGNEFSSEQFIDVRLQVENLSFSAHVDGKGILEMIRGTGSKACVLVHGEAKKMEWLSGVIQRELDMACYWPANGEAVLIACDKHIPVVATVEAPAQELLQNKLPFDVHATMEWSPKHPEWPRVHLTVPVEHAKPFATQITKKKQTALNFILNDQEETTAKTVIQYCVPFHFNQVDCGGPGQSNTPWRDGGTQHGMASIYSHLLQEQRKGNMDGWMVYKRNAADHEEIWISWTASMDPEADSIRIVSQQADQVHVLWEKGIDDAILGLVMDTTDMALR